MKANDKVNERRKHQRFRSKDGAYVVTAGNLGQILDINLQGLSFSYINLHDRATRPGELDIIVGGNDFLKNLPFDTIEENLLENKFSTTPMQMNRCGVRFGDLTVSQKSQLEEFLKHHITGEA